MNEAEKLYMGCIMSSPVENEMIFGPLFTLTRENTIKIIKYLKQNKRWNTRYIHNNAQIISNDILFETLQIFPKILRDDNNLYDFSFFQVQDFFKITDYDQAIEKQFLVLSAFNKDDNSLVYRNCLGFETSRIVLDEFKQEIERNGIIPIDENSCRVFLSWREGRIYFSFDFEKYYYTIQKTDLSSFLIRDNEDWFKVYDVAFMPLNYLGY